MLSLIYLTAQTLRLAMGTFLQYPYDPKFYRTDRFGQTVQTQIRLFLERQSDQGLHCLLFHWHHLKGETVGLNFSS